MDPERQSETISQPPLYPKATQCGRRAEATRPRPRNSREETPEYALERGGSRCFDVATDVTHGRAHSWPENDWRLLVFAIPYVEWGFPLVS